jgi:hypothetical protein
LKISANSGILLWNRKGEKGCGSQLECGDAFLETGEGDNEEE